MLGFAPGFILFVFLVLQLVLTAICVVGCKLVFA